MRKFEIGCGIVLFLAGIWLFSTFSVSQEEIVLDSRNNKAIVFTADWCLNCKIVKPIWDDQEVIEAMEGMELVVLDWTNGDEAITRLLNEFNHRSIPFAIINVDGRETTLSGIYTTAQVLEAIHEQRKNSRAERND